MCSTLICVLRRKHKDSPYDSVSRVPFVVWTYPWLALISPPVVTYILQNTHQDSFSNSPFVSWCKNSDEFSWLVALESDYLSSTQDVVCALARSPSWYEKGTEHRRCPRCTSESMCAYKSAYAPLSVLKHVPWGPFSLCLLDSDPS